MVLFLQEHCLMSFGRGFQICGPAGRKLREASVVLRWGSTIKWAEEDLSDRVGVLACKTDDR